MTETMAQKHFQSGFGSFASVAQAKLEDLMTVPGYDDPAKAEKLIKDAQAVVEKYKAEGIPVPQSPQAQAAAAAKAASTDAKAQADLRLKQELEKLGSNSEEQ